MKRSIEIWIDEDTVETLSNVLSVNMEENLLIVEQRKEISYYNIDNLLKFVINQ